VMPRKTKTNQGVKSKTKPETSKQKNVEDGVNSTPNKSPRPKKKQEPVFEESEVALTPPQRKEEEKKKTPTEKDVKDSKEPHSGVLTPSTDTAAQEPVIGRIDETILKKKKEFRTYGF